MHDRQERSAVITRCLESARPLVDYVLVEDTGSDDGTPQLVRDWLRQANIPGEVIEEPWLDFAHNRSHVLAKLREREQIDYALMINADSRLVLEDGFDPQAFKADLTHDLYDVQLRHGGSRFLRAQLCSNKLPFRFRAVLHEYLESPPGPISRATAQGLHIEDGRSGARNQNPRKYQEDAAILEAALQVETDPFLRARYRFYLAQSYRDCGEKEKSAENYLARSELGYWSEEIFYSLYQAARLKDELGHDRDEVISLYLRASDAAPGRAEALHGASRLCRYAGRNQQGYEIENAGSI